MQSLQVVLVATGDEVCNGDIVDSNGAWLAQRLFSEGIPVYGHEVVPDDPDRLIEAMERLSHTADMAVFCGGLGPTLDDYTVDAVASWLGTKPQHHLPTLERAKAMFAARGLPFVFNGARQCRIPEGTQVCANPVGLAPAFSVHKNRCHLFFLPGPPGEFKACCDACVLPHAQKAAQALGAPAVASRRYRTTELGEGLMAQAVSEIVADFPDARFGWRAAYPEVWFKVLTLAPTAQQAQQQLEQIDQRVRQTLAPRNLFGTDDETLEALVGQRLKARGLTLGVAESCTGGGLGSRITSVPGSSEWFKGGLITYSNQLKTQLLGVPEEILASHGAVSQPCAQAMAQGARRVLGTDLALAITGIAGPNGGSDAKPVGSVFIALASKDGTWCENPQLRPPRDRIRTGAAFWALNMLRMFLLGGKTDN